ncbi:hypothetical protein RRG08_053690 [Elysia crispata]|uniref:Uncharacterized protein n=1 Tax=Elysia crispata TaxID=231223 RepID=A0AAE1BA50_9GAST|nr:hypothetical protein RRG08_053690 [Elysia crispata]
MFFCNFLYTGLLVYAAPRQEGFTYAWNIFSRPWLRTASPRPQPIPWTQFERDHPRPTGGILFDPERNIYYRSSFRDHQRYGSPDIIRQPDFCSQSTNSSHDGSEFDMNKSRGSLNDRKRLFNRQCGLNKPNNRCQRPFYPRRTFWPKRMGQQYWDDDKINFYGSQNIPVTSENDSWRTLLIPQAGTLYDSTDGQFYHWDGTKLCREPWTGSGSIESSDSECHDVSMILCRHELRRLFPEEDTEDEEVYSSDDDSSTHSMQNERKEVHSYSAFHRNLMRRREEQRAS